MNEDVIKCFFLRVEADTFTDRCTKRQLIRFLILVHENNTRTKLPIYDGYYLIP